MLQSIIDPRLQTIGTFEVRRSLPYRKLRSIGPFTFLDHLGPTFMKPGEGMQVPPHPHIGISTLTYLYEGEIIHRDSLGFTQAILPGEVNWMTSGRGIVHSERVSPEVMQSGGAMHALQAWVALPAEHEEVEPSFSHHAAAELPTIEGEGTTARVVTGSAWGEVSPVATFSPQFYVDVRLSRGASLAIPDDYEERAAYVVSGEVSAGNEPPCTSGQLMVFKPGQPAFIRAESEAVVMLLGGEPIGERRMWWNFVSTRSERIEQAKADWAAGRMPLPPDDDQEWVPLPGSRVERPSPEPMS